MYACDKVVLYIYTCMSIDADRDGQALPEDGGLAPPPPRSAPVTSAGADHVIERRVHHGEPRSLPQPARFASAHGAD